MADTHIVSVFKRTEPFMGGGAFYGIELEGELLKMDEAPDLKFLFAGASWEVGFGNMENLTVEESKKTPFTTEKTNNYFAYPAITSRAFNSQYTCACYSGKGLTRAYNGDTLNQLPDLFFRTIAEQPSSQFDMQSYIPDIVLFDLGGNDFVLGIPEKENYVKKYIESIESARSLYPEAHLIISNIVLSFNDEIQDSTYIKTVNDYQESILNHFKNLQDDRVYSWVYSELGIGVWGQDLHPNVKVNENISKSLIEFISQNIGFNPVGIENNKDQSQQTIYPNPAYDAIYISSPKLGSDYKVYTLLGELVQVGKINENKIALDLPTGIYYLITEKESRRFSIVK